MKQDYFEVGQIVNTFGIKGFVKVNPLTDDVKRFEELKSVFVVKNKELIEMKIEEIKYHKNVVLVKFKGIEDINMAEKYKGCYIKIKREDAKKESKVDDIDLANAKQIKGRLRYVPLLWRPGWGLPVYDESGNLLGKVDDIYNNKSHDIYVVKDELGKQILLPSTKEVIKQVDIDNERIVVHLIDGLV